MNHPRIHYTRASAADRILSSGYTARNARRDALVARLRAAGWTFAEIGDRLGVSRQRAHQLLTLGAKRRGILGALDK